MPYVEKQVREEAIRQRTEVFDALRRVENGSTTAADADTIRQYVEKIERELESYCRWERSINEALNTGNGVYIP